MTQPPRIVKPPPPPPPKPEPDPCAKSEALFQTKQDDEVVVEEPEPEPTDPPIAVKISQRVETSWETLTTPFPDSVLLTIHRQVIEMAAARADSDSRAIGAAKAI